MAALRAQPYPSQPPDFAVFEDPTEEYGEYSGAIAESTVKVRTSCHILARLVRQQNFADAARVYDELADMGIPIERDWVYEVAAMHALRDESKDNAERLKDCIKWWSLVPPKSDQQGHLFTSIRWAIFSRSFEPDFALAINFALLAASKGYARFVAEEAIALIFRLANPDISNAFLQRFREKDAEYYQMHTSQGYDPKVHGQRCKSWYGKAIAIHVRAGRINHARQVHSNATANKIPIHGRINALLRKETNPGTGPASAFSEGPLASLFSKDFSHRFQRKSSPPSEPPPPPPIDIHELALGLRQFKNPTLLNIDHRLSASALALFMKDYKASGRTHGLRLLRKRYYGILSQKQRKAKEDAGVDTRSRADEAPPIARGKAISIWGLAEMLYHLEQRDPRGVILAFQYHFQLEGIPLMLRPIALDMWRRSRVRPGDPTYVSRVVSPQYPLNKRIWPSEHHTSLIWRVAIHMTAQTSELVSLYNELLTQVAASRADQKAAGAPFPVYHTVFDAAHFNAFIFIFAQKHRYERAFRVLRDMERLKIEPDAHTMTLITSTLAKLGDLDAVNSLLDSMEKNTSTTPPQHHSKSKEGASNLPPPNIITYTAIIRWLINNERLEDAVGITQRLFEKGGYEMGLNARTDSAIQELREKLTKVALANPVVGNALSEDSEREIVPRRVAQAS